MNRRGFTLIELLTVVAILGLLASISLPKYQHFRKKAVAAEVVAAMHAVRAGAFQYNETSGNWPATTGLGQVPAGLEPYLQGGGVNLFQGNEHQLGWLALNVNLLNARGQQLIFAYLSDGVICRGVSGLWGGAANADLLDLCGAGGGFVFLWIDR